VKNGYSAHIETSLLASKPPSQSTSRLGPSGSLDFGAEDLLLVDYQGPSPRSRW